ncbi:hypothetical protein DC522_06915 [Microvirga sp. KLBC 81]|nr:hypothetical protein DC522_06915 [Microvirga sp. KLBC 81]
MEEKSTRPPEQSRRRTRHDPPSIEDAVTAAQGLTGNIDSQVEIAAQLMGLPEDEVRPFALKGSVPSRLSVARSAPIPSKVGRTITVERRSHRSLLTRAGGHR